MKSRFYAAALLALCFGSVSSQLTYGEGFCVCLGSFTDPNNAARLSRQLENEGVATFLELIELPQGPFIRVLHKRILPNHGLASAELDALSRHPVLVREGISDLWIRVFAAGEEPVFTASLEGPVTVTAGDRSAGDHAEPSPRTGAVSAVRPDAGPATASTARPAAGPAAPPPEAAVPVPEPPEASPAEAPAVTTPAEASTGPPPAVTTPAEALESPPSAEAPAAAPEVEEPQPDGSETFANAVGERPSRDVYRTEGVPLDFRAAVLGNIPENTLLVLTGKASLLSHRNDQFYVNLYTRESNSSYKYIGDTVRLVFDERPAIIEGDIVSVMGRYQGTTSGYGSDPLIWVDYYEILP